jgi:acyl transferase domain-containing protein/acyl carrier protein
MSAEVEALPPNAVAIIGMAGRFPGARTPEQLWHLVRDGREAIRRLSDAELRAAGVPASLLANPAYVRAAATLDGMDEFDAGFFGFSPRDAAIMDPQHRHFLECAWEALESAGYTPEGFGGSIGVFGGCGMQTYFARNLLNNPQLMASAGYFLVRHTGNDKDFLTTRVSYQLNLKGPSVSVQTACSTSLVAVHLASQSLLNRECDMALAGGVTIELPHGQGYLYEEGEILSPDGHCRAFDAASKGTVFGSGAGLVVLRRLEDAVEAGDHIHAVILASAVNNDGAGKVGYLAPSVDGQAAVVAEALALAGASPESVTFIETHGTGTPVGDPIEVAALTEAFGRQTTRRHFCAIGSIKTNIGHLDTAAGVASLIKAVSAVEHAQLPPSLHFEHPNPAIPFEETPFYVNARLQPWTTAGPRRAGVTSLGVGGTNVHVLIEEAPPRRQHPEPVRHHLLMLSARSEPALDQARTRLASHLTSHPDLPLADVAFTLHTGRRAFGHRFALTADTLASAIHGLTAAGDDPHRRRGVAGATPPPLTFMFPGGGAQHPGMAAELYATEPVFRAEVDRCLACAATHVATDLRSLVLAPASAPGHQELAAALERPSLALPSLFTIEYALAILLRSWGLAPDSYIGHSLGEYVAACLTGVMSLDDAIGVVAARGRLFETLPPGMMVSVPTAADALQATLPSDLSVAAINGPALCVVSGPVESVQEFASRLAARGTETQRLRIAVAAHSRALEPILDEFLQVMRGVRLNAPDAPFISNVTGTWISADQAASPAYWVTHLRSTVQYAAGLATLAATPDRMFVEVGPGTALASLARLQTTADRVVSTLGRASDARVARASVVSAAGHLWAHGWTLSPSTLHDTAHRRRVPLPAYPFEHQRYWIEPTVHASEPDAAGASARDVSRWLHVPVWTRADVPPEVTASGSSWVLCVNARAEVAGLIGLIREQGGLVTIITPGDRFASVADDEFQADPLSATDLGSALKAITAATTSSLNVLVCWSLATATDADRDLLGMLSLARALAEAGPSEPIRLAVLTRDLQQVDDGRIERPEQALATGALPVIAAEMAGITPLALDVAGEAFAALGHIGEPGRAMAASVISEVLSPVPATSVALRASGRWLPALRPLPAAGPQPAPVRPNGTYLITGGLGGMALALAECLARSARVNLVLVGRRAMPARSAWTQWLESHPADDEQSLTIRRVLSLEALGARVDLEQVDVAVRPDTRELVARVIAHHGAIHGVIHAAGVLDDSLIHVKSADSARGVLRPKVTGTLALHEALGDVDLDFWVNCSSVSALIGLPGQADYAAANAFLDAFSRWRGSRDRGRTVAVDWQAWRDVGMLNAPSRSPAVPPASEGWTPKSDGLLRYARTAGATVQFRTPFSTKTDWVLDEHRLSGGEALLPGTALVALAIEAARNALSSPAVEVSELVFLAPFRASEAPVTLQVSIDTNSGELVMSSGAGADLVEHVRGSARRAPAPAPDALDLAAIGGRCHTGRTPAAPNLSHLIVGAHWQADARVSLGSDEALAFVTLPPAFRHEAAAHAVHPALLDVATACALWLARDYAPARDFYVPLSYGRITAHAPMPASIGCFVRRVGDGAATDLAVFDLTVTDTAGRVVIEVERFVVRRLAPFATLDMPPQTERRTRFDTSQAMTAVEGGAAFLQVLRSLPLTQVVVGPQSIADLAAEAARVAAGPVRSTPAADRARLTPIVEPRDDMERQVASIWRDLLGVQSVSIDDNFFELGGHSLLLAQIGSRIRKVAGVQVPVAQLFEHPTIRHMADYCRTAQRTDDEPALVAVPRERLRRAKSAAGRTDA